MSGKSIMTEIKEHTGKLELEPGKIYAQEDLDAQCAAKFGPSWVWNDNLQCCVDNRVKPTVYMPLEKIKLKLIPKEKKKSETVFTQKSRPTKPLIEEISASTDPIHQLHRVAVKVDDITQKVDDVTLKVDELEDAVMVFLARWSKQIEAETEVLAKLNKYLDKWG